MRAGGDTRLADAPAYEIHIAVGDSLLHGDPPGRLPGMHTPGQEEAMVAAHGYEAEDVEAVRALLGRGWHAVVGNPPYITVKDPALNAAYRTRFDTVFGQIQPGCSVHRAVLAVGLLRRSAGADRLRGPDHGQLVHEARDGQEAHP